MNLVSARPSGVARIRSGMSFPPPEYPTLVGTVIANKYMVERLLGAGGMGLVFLAHHIDLARPVAVKLIRRELMETESIAERFLREARAAARIQSEHVGRVLDVGRLESGEPFIVMEYLEGLDLAERLLQQRRFAPEEAVDLILEAGEAIAEAHQSQIVHRDLKPENLFLARQPDGASIVKVLDFGISKQLGEPSQRVLTSPSTALGSPQYMAPEQMEGVHVDVRADIWALGSIVYEMVCGRKAFEGETLAQVCVQVLSGKVTPVRELAPDVPVGLAVAIEQCLQQQKSERFDNMSAFATALMPYGTERARVSANRIARVLGLTPPDDDRSSSTGATRPANEKDVDPMRRTEVATPVEREVSVGLPASSHTVEVNRSASRWPIFLGLLGVIGLGAVLWVFTRSAVSGLDAESTVEASSVALDGLKATTVLEPARSAPSMGEPTSGETASPQTRTSVGSPTDAGAQPLAPAEEKKPKLGLDPAGATAPNAMGAEQAKPRAVPLPRRPRAAEASPAPRSASAPSSSEAKSSEQRAFDRDSFGGRR